MKNKGFAMLMASLLVMLMASCRAHYPVAQQSGKEDVGYLLFVSDGNHANSSVEVAIDNGTVFTATTVKATKANRRGTQYSVSTGRHNITVKRGGKVLYQKNIMVAPQLPTLIRKRPLMNCKRSCLSSTKRWTKSRKAPARPFPLASRPNTAICSTRWAKKQKQYR